MKCGRVDNMMEQKHPEQLDNEYFLGNMTMGNYINNVNWNKKRLGRIAYDINENMICCGCIKVYPCFVNKEEVDKKLSDNDC
jgi:hypothetical protein